MAEWNDVYDENRALTGRKHLRGTPWKKGDYGLVVCVWVYDGRGHLLLTRRAPQKSFPGTWENSGGAVRAGEDSLTAIVRELREETGIVAAPEDFRLLDQGKDKNCFYDFYCLKADVPLSQIRLQPGETDDVMWASFAKVHWLIRTKRISAVIAKQFLRQEPQLRMYNSHKNTP